MFSESHGIGCLGQPLLRHPDQHIKNAYCRTGNVSEELVVVGCSSELVFDSRNDQVSWAFGAPVDSFGPGTDVGKVLQWTYPIYRSPHEAILLRSVNFGVRVEKRKLSATWPSKRNSTPTYK